MIIYRKIDASNLEGILNICQSLGWNDYTGDPDRLARGIQKSLLMYGAFDNGWLIGYVRCVGDGEFSVLIQDLAVKEEYWDQEVAERLVSEVVAAFPQAHMLALAENDDRRLDQLYRAQGYVNAHNAGLEGYIR
jgi:ribosomal protein S18 acetylase RimI-like enzyme